MRKWSVICPVQVSVVTVPLSTLPPFSTRLLSIVLASFLSQFVTTSIIFIWHCYHHLHFWLVLQQKIVIFRSCNQFFSPRSVLQSNLSNKIILCLLIVTLSDSWYLATSGREPVLFLQDSLARLTKQFCCFLDNTFICHCTYFAGE